MYYLKNYKVKYACYAPQFGDCIVFINNVVAFYLILLKKNIYCFYM